MVLEARLLPTGEIFVKNIGYFLWVTIWNLIELAGLRLCFFLKLPISL